MNLFSQLCMNFRIALILAWIQFYPSDYRLTAWNILRSQTIIRRLLNPTIFPKY